MTDNAILRDLGVIVLAAALFVTVARAARIPSIVAYILAGLFLGPVTGLVEVSEPLHLIAEVGIALLLFLVGLELSFEKVRDIGTVAVLTGLGQMLLTAVLGYGLATLLGYGPGDAAFLAVALMFSSTVVVVKLLAQTGGFRALYGRIAVGILLVQDLVVVIVLTFVAGLGRGESLEASGIARGLALAFGGMAVLLATALLAARHALPRIFHWVARSQEALFIWSLCWCFLFILGAEAMGLSLEIGAFLAGISLAQLPFNHELRRRVQPLTNFFIAVFFVTLGIQMELGAAADRWGTTLLLSLFALLVKPVVIAWLVGRQGYGRRTAFLSGTTLAQISEFSLIFAALGVSTGLIEGEVLSVLGAVGLITMGASAYLILHADGLYALAERLRLPALLGLRTAEAAPTEDTLRDHVIVVGMNSLGRRIVEELARRGERTLAIDTDPAKLRGLPGKTLHGNVEYLAVLEEAGLERAKLLVSALQIEDANSLLAFRCREAGVPSSIHAFDQSLVPQLRELGATHLIDSKAAGTLRIMQELRDAGVFGP